MSHSSTYNPQSMQLHAILEQMCTEYSISYSQAYNHYFELQQVGKVPLIDWSKIK